MIKKTIIFWSLFIVLFSQAQSVNTNYIKTLKQLNEKGAREFADKIASASGKYVFLQVKTNSTTQYTLRYISSAAKNKGNYTSQSCKECMDIKFKKSNQTYAFDNVWGNFSDLFPAWKAVFVPEAKTSDYHSSDQDTIVEWSRKFDNIHVSLGRLGVAWYLVIK